jgi:signal peptidase II
MGLCPTVALDGSIGPPRPPVTPCVENGRVSQSSSQPANDPRPPRRGLLLVLVALVVVTADVLTKVAVVAALEGERPVRLLGGFAYLQLVRNPGAAFSMATGMTWVLSLIAISVVIGIIWILPRLRSIGWAIGLGLVLAGALGNLTDRIFRAPGPLRGHVIDFVSVFGPNGEYFPVFNVADSAIVCGGALIVLLALLGRDYDGRSTRRVEKAPEVEAS